MTWVIIRTLLMLLLVAGLAVASLWLWRKTQMGGGTMAAKPRGVTLVDSVALGPTSRLIVVEFDNRRLLLSATRQGLTLLSQGDVVDA